jgi:hypothetical protein
MHGANNDCVSIFEAVANSSAIGLSEIRDRNNFRDEQQAAPQPNNSPIDP